jgi:hypothetical protein
MTQDHAVAPWWEQAELDWTDPELLRALRLFAVAYEVRDAIARVVRSAGLDWSRAPDGTDADEIWRWVLRHAAARGKVLDLAAVVLNDKAVETIHPSLLTLLGDQRVATARRHALRFGAADETIGARDLLGRLEDAVTEPPDEPVGRLHAITAASTGFDSPRQYMQAMHDAGKRTAMIEIGRRPAGTGFLVAPDVLLTAAHVFDVDTWPPTVTYDVTARFDFVDEPGRAVGETGLTVAVIDYLAGSLPTAREVAGNVDSDWNAPLDHLDYALVRLARPVGSEADVGGAMRGWYRLADATPYAFEHSSLYFIVQHPLGQTQKTSYITSPPTVNVRDPERRTRIRYQANTLEGSSGSPIVDFRGVLVGLHHYGQNARRVGERAINQGVPASVIAAAVNRIDPSYLAGAAQTPATAASPMTAAAVDAAAAATEDSPYDTLDVAGLPFIDRQLLRDALRGIAESGGRRCLVITGGERSGVSHSYQLVSYVASKATRCRALQRLAPGGLMARRIDLRRYQGIPVEERQLAVARDLLIALDIIKPTDTLAQEARSVHSILMWVDSTLRSAPDRQHWIFIDSLDDRVTSGHGGMRELLHGILELAGDVQNPLRVVLAGRVADQVEHPLVIVADTDRILSLTRAHAAEWVTAMATEQELAIDEGRMQAELDALFAKHGGLEQIAPRLPALLQKVATGRGP